MRLTDLDPELESDRHEGKDYLIFLCPVCPKGESRFGSCLIMIPVSAEHTPGEAWGMMGDTKTFKDLTLTPSVWHHCKSDPHFFVKNGEIELL
jgi:hypothetical protein